MRRRECKRRLEEGELELVSDLDDSVDREADAAERPSVQPASTRAASAALPLPPPPPSFNSVRKETPQGAIDGIH